MAGDGEREALHLRELRTREQRGVRSLVAALLSAPAFRHDVSEAEALEASLGLNVDVEIAHVQYLDFKTGFAGP